MGTDGYRLIPLFQSHAGSIEAYGDGASWRLLFLFQSHAGSIEAGRGCAPWLPTS